MRMKKFEYFVPVDVVKHVAEAQSKDRRTGTALPPQYACFVAIIVRGMEQYDKDETFREAVRTFTVRAETTDSGLFLKCNLPVPETVHAALKQAATRYEMAGGEKVRLYDFVSSLINFGRYLIDYSTLPGKIPERASKMAEAALAQ